MTGAASHKDRGKRPNALANCAASGAYFCGVVFTVPAVFCGSQAALQQMAKATNLL